APLWIVDFPLLEWSEEDQRFYAMHHPFTAPKPEHEKWFYSDRKEDLERVCANAYDFVLNGTELGGGSIRIHSPEVQEKMFEKLGFTKEEAWERFGFLMGAFKYGTPPHGGLAYGLDRLAMLITRASSIRDVIAFPKVQTASCLMSGCPDVVDQAQLEELHIETVADKE
ncbi:MAG: amino acid--tRNA ligase-related protein, partial [Eubacteriales bacterium]|nr:amino acid--tRNA ligase-related protein [Eubacteriales bacterium]